MKLFESIKPLFVNKPLLVVANKADVLRLDDLPEEKRAVLKEIEDDANIPLFEMSTITDLGVMEVKTEACERLLSYRVDQKIKTKKVNLSAICYLFIIIYTIIHVMYTRMFFKF